MRKNPISKPSVEKVEYLLDDIKKGKLIPNHPLQRYSGMWTTEQKSNLIRRILQGGEFLPILVCTQYDEYGCEVKYLIDGVQRMSSFEDYLDDRFAISKNTIDSVVSYDGVLYEYKISQSGKFILKKIRKGNERVLVPILDENGKPQIREQSIDIRGLRYSELPPELQEKIKRYVVQVQYKLECTDRDIQVEILDYNSGTKMNDAQIGKNRLGAEFAKIVIDLSNHPFVKNQCGFTPDNRKKGVIDRAINEALMLVNFGAENWVSSHKDLCRKLSVWLTTEHTDKLRSMFDDLDCLFHEEPEIKEYLTLKEFFVVMANYSHFLDSGYKKECYAEFLRDFITVLSFKKDIPTGDVDDDGDDILDNFRTVYMTGTKQKNIVEGRLKKMNEMLDAYLVEHCNGMFDDVEDVEEEVDTFAIPEDAEVLQEFAQNFASDAFAVQSLMLSTDCPFANFETETMKQTVEWYGQYGNQEMLSNCLFYKSIVDDNGIDSEDMNLPFYIYAVKYITEGMDDIDVDEWLKKFKQTAFQSIDNDEKNIKNSNSTIMLKESEIIQNLKGFSQKSQEKER